MRTIRVALPVLAASLALTACAQAGPATPVPASTSGGSTVSSSPSEPTPGNVVDPSPKGGPGASSALMTLTGTVTPGVEPGCLLLDGYLLFGGPADVVRSGARVTVTGRPQPDMMTTCQQGIPFKVESAKTA